MRRSAHQEKSLSIAFVFLFCVILLVIGGVFLKFFLLLRASSFDSSHQFIVAINQDETNNAIFVFSPQRHTATILQISGQSFPQKALDVPVDASVTTEFSSQITKLTQNILFKSTKDNNLTILDKIRLFLFINSLKSGDLHSVSIALPLDEATREKTFPDIFTDSTIFADNESIAIVNSTGQSGVGAKAAHMLSTIGVNVISVTTGDKDTQQSLIVSTHPQSYTTQRIGKLFHALPKKALQESIADTTLTLGKDSALLLQ